MSTSTLDALYGSMYGSMFFSTVMSTGFYGVTCMQTFFYYVHYPNDPQRMKIFVAVLWALDTVHQALTISGAYKYIIAGLVDPSTMLSGAPELMILLTALVALPTQGFFVYRIYLFNKKNIVAPLLWVPLAIYQLVSTLIYVTKALYNSNGLHTIEFISLGDPFFMDIATSTLSVAAGVDVLTAVCLTFLLFRKQSTTGFSGTANVLQRLTVFAVNTGIWTATFALLTVIFLHLYPTNLIYVVFAVPLCSVYCNTLLANLNARAYIRGETTTHNIDADLFATSTCDKYHGESKVVSFHTSPNAEGQGMTFLVANRPTPSTSENACV